MENIVIGVSVDTDEAIKNVNKFSSELGDLKKQLEQEKASLSQIKKEFKALNSPVDQLTKTQKALRDELEKQGKTLDDVSKAYASQEGKVKALNKNYKEAENSVSGLSAGTGRLKASIVDGLVSFTALSGGVTLLVAGIKNAVGGIIDINKEISQAETLAKTYFDLSGDAAREFAKEAKVVGDVFGKDLNEILESSNVLVQEFGISAKEALGLIDEGFVKGADSRGDFLNQLNEYSSQFTQLGIDAEGAIAIIAQQEQAGVFSDKGVDALKEFGIRLRELTPSAEDALAGIGLSGELIQKEIQQGTKTVFEAAQEVSEKLNELPATSKEVGTALADLFGGAGEDAGKFIFNLSEINTDLEDVELNISEGEQASQNLTRAWSQFTTEVATGDGTISNFFSGFQNIIADVLDGLALIGTSTDELRERAVNTVSDQLTSQALSDNKKEYEQFYKSITEANKNALDQNLIDQDEYLQRQLNARSQAANLMLNALKGFYSEDAKNRLEQAQKGGDAVEIQRAELRVKSVEKQIESFEKLAQREESAVEKRRVAQLSELELQKEAKAGNEEAIKQLQLITTQKEAAAEKEALNNKRQSEANAKQTKREEEALVLEKEKVATQIENIDKRIEAENIALQQEQDIADLRADLKAEDKSEDEINFRIKKERLNQGLDNQLTALADERDALLENELLTEEQKLEIKDQFKELELVAEEEYQIALSNLVVGYEEDRTEKLEKEAKKRAKAEEKETAERIKAVEGYAQSVGNALGQAIASGEDASDSFAQNIALTALDGLRGIIPVLVAQIFGQSFAQLGPIGGAVATAGVTGTLYGLLGAARSSVSSLEEGGQIPKYQTGGLLRGKRHSEGGIPLFRNGSQIAEVEGGEFVVNRTVTAQNLSFLQNLNAGAFTPNSPTVADAENQAASTYDTIKSNQEREPLAAIVSESEITRSQSRISKFERTARLG